MGFCLVLPFKLSFLCLKWYGQKCPLGLCRSLCQIFKNENVLIIFPINPRETARESFFPGAGGITTTPTSNLLSTSDCRFGPPSLFFFFSLPYLMLDLLFGHAGGACSARHRPRVQHSGKELTWMHWKREARSLKQPDLPGNSQAPVCVSAWLGRKVNLPHSSFVQAF